MSKSNLLRNVAPSEKNLPAWALIRRFKQRLTLRFEAAVAAETDNRVNDFVRLVVERIERSRKRHEEARAARLAERDWKGFVPIAVSLRGFRSGDGDEHYVLIELNRQTGELRPAKLGFRQILASQGSCTIGWFRGRASDPVAIPSQLCGPTWSKIDGEPNAVVLLGEVYRYTGDHSVVDIRDHY